MLKSIQARDERLKQTSVDLVWRALEHFYTEQTCTNAKKKDVVIKVNEIIESGLTSALQGEEIKYSYRDKITNRDLAFRSFSDGIVIYYDTFVKISEIYAPLFSNEVFVPSLWTFYMRRNPTIIQISQYNKKES